MALNSKAVVLIFEGRLREAQLLLEGAVAASRGGISETGWWRAMNNLAQTFFSTDRLDEVLALNDDIIEHARQRGDREVMATQLSTSVGVLRRLGRWDEALARLADVEAMTKLSLWARSELIEAIPIYCERGELDRAEELLREQEWQRETDQPEFLVACAAVEARLLR